MACHCVISAADPFRCAVAKFYGVSRSIGTELRQPAVCEFRVSIAGVHGPKQMHEVEVHLEMKLADAMGELRVWLDHNDCVPVSFDIKRQRRGVLVRVVFADDEQAEQFERRFAR